MQSSFRVLLPLVIIFIAFLLIPFLLSDMLLKFNIDKNVLLGSNILFFIISLVSFSIQRRGMMHKNPHVFVRTVTGSMMIKMLFCVIAVIAYVYLSGDGFNKRAVFISLFLYLIYLFTEVIVVMKMNKKQHA